MSQQAASQGPITSPMTFSVYSGDELVRTETFTQDIIKIGRLQSSHLFLEDDDVSRMHAVIEVTEGGEVFIIDLGSASGTQVNGEKVNKSQLKDGDELHIGKFRIKVQMNAAEVGAGTAPAASGEADSSGETPKEEFNPFQAEAATVGADPFAARAADDNDYYAMKAQGPPIASHEVETSERAVEVTVLWGDRNVLRVDHMSPPRDYYVGEPTDDEPVDYVIGSEALGASRLPVCVARGAGAAAIIPEGATGEATIAGYSRSFDLLKAEGELKPSSELRGAMEIILPEGSSARVCHKDFTFVVKDVKAGKKVAGAARFDLRPLAYVAAAGLLASLVLVMFYFAPPRPRGLSGDLLDTDSRLVQFLMEPEAFEPETPDWLGGSGEAGGGKGTSHDGDEGQLGDEKAEKTRNKYGIKGPKDNEDPVMAREKAEAEAATAGILGTLAGMQGAFNSPTSPYGADYALGADAMSALGAMTGTDIGQNFGFGGLGLRGTGRGGGGTGQGTIGLGNFGTIGRGGGKGDGEGGYGRGVGNLGGRSARVPTVRGGGANVFGALSKEVIRRVVRRHLNEVKYCYEQQLTSRPDLAGRVTVKFVISPTGSVQSAVVSDSSLRNQAVESCVTQAVRRWTFPAPDGGGIVVVNYPFLLDAAGQ